MVCQRTRGARCQLAQLNKTKVERLYLYQLLLCPAGRYKDRFVDAVHRVIPATDWLPSADKPVLQLPLWGLGEVVQDPTSHQRAGVPCYYCAWSCFVGAEQV